MVIFRASERRVSGGTLRVSRQRGFALLELTIAVALVCMLAIWAADKLLRDVDAAAEQAAGLWLLDTRRALDGMLARHGASLGAGVAPADEQGRLLYADPWAPTLAELKAQGHLSGAFPDAGPLGLRVVIKLWRGEACPGAGCRVDALAYSDTPLPGPGSRRPDFARIAGIVMATEGAGGSVSELAPDRLRGATFDLPNPPAPGMAPLPVGTVAVRADREAATTSRYLQLSDPRNPQFLGDVSAGGTLSASGRLVAGEHLKLGATVVPGNPCPENGLLARDDDGSLLSCVTGVWSAPGGFGGAFSHNNSVGCSGLTGRAAVNPRTGDCSCPPGFRAVLVASGGVADRLEGGWTQGYVCMR
jgi:prepilin-type N-terminal cleavage/methylation domain-containing protein